MDNKLKIINYLGRNIGQAFSLHELSKSISIPYATFYRTVLEMDCLVAIKPVGRAKTIMLNLDNASIKSYLAVSSEEHKKEFLEKQPLIRKIVSEMQTKEIVLLFGSYAKGVQRGSSDIDIMVINNNGKRTLSFSKYEALFKVKINPLFVSIKEFRQMLKEKDENVGKQALKYHVVLNNPEGFWRCVL